MTFVFHSCVPGAVAPRVADPTLFGSASFRAATHCEPFRAATGCGWYLYPPLSFFLRWDGSAFSWLPEGTKRWLPVTNVPARSLAYLRDETPSDLYTLELPVLSALPEPG